MVASWIEIEVRKAADDEASKLMVVATLDCAEAFPVVVTKA